MEKRALGKGLSALIPTREESQENRELVLHIPISKIKTNKYQPRIEFNKERLAELASSIKEKGVVQPVLVRKDGDKYELIAGERRLRAVTSLGMDTIPAIVKDVADIRVVVNDEDPFFTHHSFRSLNVLQMIFVKWAR